MAADVQSSDALAKLLVQVGAATPDQIKAGKRAIEEAGRNGRALSLGDALVEQGVITEAMLNNFEKKISGLSQLGPYKLLRKLGEGGMGVVYLAEDTVALRPVALKVLSKKLATQEIFLKRFKREAIATGKLNHVNIVAAYACDEESGFHYYAMEYCDGQPLDKTLRKVGRFAPELAVDIITQVVRGLQHAHHNGIIHRDIKPANIFMTKDNVAKILDLGLSKSVNDSAQSHMTLEGTTVGTPHYVSPEQARGEADIDGRSDIYSLGATFYMLLTGETPYKGPSPAVIMTKHLTDPVPDPRIVRPSTPTPIAEIVMKMMAKDRADRYQSCDAVLVDLELVAEGKPPTLGVNADDEGPKRETGRFGRITGKAKKITGKQAPVGESSNEPLITSEPIDLGPGSSSARRASRELRASTRESSRIKKPVDLDEPPAAAKVETPAPKSPGASASRTAAPGASASRNAAPGASASRTTTPAGLAQTAKLEPIESPTAPTQQAPAAVAAVPPTAVPATASSGVPKSMIFGGIALLVIGIVVGSMFNGKHEDTKTADSGPKPPTPATPERQKPVTPPEPAPKPPEPEKISDTKSKTPEPARISDTKAKPPEPEPAKVKEPPPEQTKPKEPPPPLVIVKPLEVDTPLPQELLPRPAPDPVLTKAPVTPVNEDPALEVDAVKLFDKIGAMIKRNQQTPAKEALEDLQTRLGATRWYAQNRHLVEAASLELEWAKHPWGNFFATAAHPLTENAGDRWDLRYNLLTTLSFDRKEWTVFGNANLNGSTGAWQFDHGGEGFAALVNTLPIADLERLEATIWPRPGSKYGWALYSSIRSNTPYLACWIEDDGKVWVNDEKKTVLKIKAPTGPVPRKLVVYFRKNRAWMEIGNQREELEIPVSPHWMLPALIAGNAALHLSDIRIEGGFDPGYIKRMEEENDHVKKLRQGAQERFQLKVTISSEASSAAFVGGQRASPDSKGNYQPQEYSFALCRGSIISVLQFPKDANAPGPILVNLTLSDGRQTGTGLTQRFWSASGEVGNWKGDALVAPGWIPVPIEETKPKADAPADAKSKFVTPQNRGVLLHYVFDPDDFK